MYQSLQQQIKTSSFQGLWYLEIVAITTNEIYSFLQSFSLHGNNANIIIAIHGCKYYCRYFSLQPLRCGIQRTRPKKPEIPAQPLPKIAGGQLHPDRGSVVLLSDSYLCGLCLIINVIATKLSFAFVGLVVTKLVWQGNGHFLYLVLNAMQLLLYGGLSFFDWQFSILFFSNSYLLEMVLWYRLLVKMRKQLNSIWWKCEKWYL